MQTIFHQALLHLTRHTRPMWTGTKCSAQMCRTALQVTHAAYGGFWLRHSAHKISSADDEICCSALQSLLDWVIQIDLVTDVHCNHSICAQSKYSAQMCITAMQAYMEAWCSWVSCTQPVTVYWDMMFRTSRCRSQLTVHCCIWLDTLTTCDWCGLKINMAPSCAEHQCKHNWVRCWLMCSQNIIIWWSSPNCACIDVLHNW